MVDRRTRRVKNSGKRKGPWSHSEIERLKRLYGLKPDVLIARDLERSVDSVRRMARNVFNTGEPRIGPWSGAEVRQLKNYLGAATVDVIAMIMRRPKTEVHRKIAELKNQAHSGPWSSSEKQDLKRLYGTRSNSDLELILGRPEQEIVETAQALCLAKDKGFRRRDDEKKGEEKPARTRMPRWTEDEKGLLRDLYPDRPNLEIAKALNRTVKSVVSKAHDMGLKKSNDRLRDMGRENVKVRYGSEEEENAAALETISGSEAALVAGRGQVAAAGSAASTARGAAG